MLDLSKDTQPITNFRRQSGDFLKQLRKTKHPVVLSVEGKPTAVVQDADTYQRLLDSAWAAEETVRQRLDDVNNGTMEQWTHLPIRRGVRGDSPQAWHTALIYLAEPTVPHAPARTRRHRQGCQWTSRNRTPAERLKPAVLR